MNYVGFQKSLFRKSQKYTVMGFVIIDLQVMRICQCFSQVFYKSLDVIVPLVYIQYTMFYDPLKGCSLLKMARHIINVCNMLNSLIHSIGVISLTSYYSYSHTEESFEYEIKKSTEKLKSLGLDGAFSPNSSIQPSHIYQIAYHHTTLF